MLKPVNLILFLCILINLLACQNPDKEQGNKNEKTLDSTQIREEQSVNMDSLKPVMVDDIHYYTLDRDKMNQFFIEHFAARPMAQKGKPLNFIDFLSVNPDQSTLNISAQGPFPGIAVVDSSRWQRETVQPRADLPPMYGVHWLAFKTKDLAKVQQDFEAKGLTFESKDFKLPHDPEAKAFSVWAPDYNRVVVVERPDYEGETPFAIDHIQLLVGDKEANVKFFEEVFYGKVQKEQDGLAIMEVAKHRFVIAEAAALGISVDAVVKRDPKEFRPNIDHIGFQYADPRLPYEAAKAKGYKFSLAPIRMRYYQKETSYRFAIVFSPDSLQFEMYSEDGRIGPRRRYAN